MPELPEMETLRRDLDREVGGKRIKTTEVPGRTAISHSPKKQLIERLDGVKINGADRRGLLLTLKLDSSELLVIDVRENGDVAVSYTNGQSRVIARVPLVAFNDPDKLQRLDGQAFMRTAESGEARVTDSASNGVGKLVTGSLERSNVDIASEFTKLIVAQRAYTANTRVVTTSDEMLQETLNMRR